ncbi:MAG: LCP family protein [Ruminococcus sp.]|nr:LCP family protein [Ruminococcus sp.]
MNLQDNGNNHNRGPKLNGGDDALSNFIQSDEYERIAEIKGDAPDSPEDIINAANRAAKLQEAMDKENSSAYDDLDDYVFRYSHHRHRRRRDTIFSRIASQFGIELSHHRHHHHRRGKMKTWKKVLITIVSIILVLLIGSAGTFLLMFNMGRNALVGSEVNIAAPVDAETTDNGMYVLYDGVQYKFNENITSVLCMGIDRDSIDDVDEYEGTGGDADTIFVLTLDLETGRTTIINISRDTMAEIGIYSDEGAYVGTRETQICLAYAYGDGKETSCDNQLAAVRQLLFNVPINSYLALDINGISAINDAVGGVTVTSPETIGNFNAGETYTLHGDEADSFVRSRSHATIEGNSLRMQRQKTYLESFANTVFTQTKSDITTPVTIFNEATPYLCTNIDAPKVAYLSVNAMRGNFHEFDIKTIEGEMKKGKPYAEFYPDEDKLFRLILDVYYTPVA